MINVNEISLLRAGFAIATYREYLKIRSSAKQAKANATQKYTKDERLH